MKNLKNALLGNAIFSAVSGLSLAFFHSKIARVFGFENSVAFLVIGLALLFFASTVWYESRRLRPFFVKLIVAQDALWVLGSTLLLILRPFEISGTGNFLIAAVALVVAFFGWRQLLGLKTSD